MALLLDTLSLLATLAVLTATWRNVWLATALLAVLTTLRFAVRRSPRDLGIFAFGFVFASLAEVVQVWAGLYAYAQPCPLVIPVYNFFLWGTVLLTSSQWLRALEARFGAPAGLSWSRLATENALYGAITALLCLASAHQLAIAVVFATVLVARLVLVAERGNLWFLAVGMLLGPMTESWLVHSGIYRFSQPLVGNLPLWHPIYWGLIVLYLRPMVRAADLLAVSGLVGLGRDTASASPWRGGETA